MSIPNHANHMANEGTIMNIILAVYLLPALPVRMVDKLTFIGHIILQAVAGGRVTTGCLPCRHAHLECQLPGFRSNILPCPNAMNQSRPQVNCKQQSWMQRPAFDIKLAVCTCKSLMSPNGIIRTSFFVVSGVADCREMKYYCRNYTNEYCISSLPWAIINNKVRRRHYKRHTSKQLQVYVARISNELWASVRECHLTVPRRLANTPVPFYSVRGKSLKMWRKFDKRSKTRSHRITTKSPSSKWPFCKFPVQLLATTIYILSQYYLIYIMYLSVWVA